MCVCVCVCFDCLEVCVYGWMDGWMGMVCFIGGIRYWLIEGWGREEVFINMRQGTHPNQHNIPTLSPPSSSSSSSPSVSPTRCWGRFLLPFFCPAVGGYVWRSKGKACVRACVCLFRKWWLLFIHRQHHPDQTTRIHDKWYTLYPTLPQPPINPHTIKPRTPRKSRPLPPLS